MRILKANPLPLPLPLLKRRNLVPNRQRAPNQDVGRYESGAGCTASVKCATSPANYSVEFVELSDRPVEQEDNLRQYLEKNNSRLSNRLVRTVELIPRQSSLNVNDMKLNVRAGAFNFVLQTLFGFGSQLNIQRQREQFS